MMRANPPSNRDPAGWTGLGLTIGFHAALIAMFLSYVPARNALESVAPLMVQLIKPELPSPPVPKPEHKVDKPPKPLPVKQSQPRPAPEAPILAAQAPAALALSIAVPPEPKPVLPIEARPAPAAPAALAPIAPPSFNADYLDNPAPAYPTLARRMGEEGKVLLRVYVETSGLPSKVEIRTSSGSERLDAAALEAVKRWKFVPAKQGDKAVPAHVLVPISFNLRS